MLKNRVTLQHKERSDVTHVARLPYVAPLLRKAHPGNRLVTISGKTSEVPVAVVLEDKSPRNVIYRNVVRPINNYIRLFRYLPISESLTLGKYTMPAIGLAALGTGVASWVSALPLLRIPLMVGGYVGGNVGAKLVDKASEITTGKNFAQNVEDATGLDQAAGSFLNPGAWVGGYKGFNWGSNSVKRGAEVFMRVSPLANPLPEAVTNLKTLIRGGTRTVTPSGRLYDTGGRKRVFDIAKYIVTGKQTGPFGWSNSLSKYPGITTFTGFVGNARPYLGKTDIIDAVLYGKEIDPAWGLKKIQVGGDFGPHETIVRTNPQYASKANKIQTYEYIPLGMDLIEVDPNLVVVTGKWKGNPGGHVNQNPYFGLGADGPVPNVAGHIVQEGLLANGAEVARSLDIWKFLPSDYETGWGKLGWLAKEGLKTVDHITTPIITKSPWLTFEGNKYESLRKMYTKPIDWETVFPPEYSFDPSKIAVESITKKEKGGSIHIKDKNKGKFTASAKRAGLSVQEHAKSVLSNPNATPLQKKRANFARNAAKWNKK